MVVHLVVFTDRPRMALVLEHVMMVKRLFCKFKAQIVCRFHSHATNLRRISIRFCCRLARCSTSFKQLSGKLCGIIRPRGATVTTRSWLVYFSAHLMLSLSLITTTHISLPYVFNHLCAPVLCWCLQLVLAIAWTLNYHSCCAIDCLLYVALVKSYSSFA